MKMAHAGAISHPEMDVGKSTRAYALGPIDRRVPFYSCRLCRGFRLPCRPTQLEGAVCFSATRMWWWLRL
jgi:hypothetical protein